MRRAAVLFAIVLATVSCGTSQDVEEPPEHCGVGTYFDSDTAQCLCGQDFVQSSLNDSNVINLAGIFDTTAYDWGPDVFDVTVQLINKGEWGVLPPGKRLEYRLQNSNCDETTAARSYWKLRTANRGRPMDGIVGARCSGASISLARISGLEHVPHISPASNSARLSDSDEFPFFSRLVAPNNENGEVGALIAMLRSFGWERVTILATDTTFAKDLVTDFRRLWVGVHDDWEGEVAYSDTIRINTDGSINEDSVKQALEGVPTDEPKVNSRIIFLAAHTQHAFPILKQAHQAKFQPDTIWVGPSSWVGRDDYGDFSWLPGIPGYLGVSVFRNRDETYDTFMQHLQDYQRSLGKTALVELPTFAAETVDSIRARTSAIANAENKTDGMAVVQRLRQIEFQGVSGYVSFTENGDRRDPQYSVFNAQESSVDRKINWKDIGTTGISIGSTNLVNGVRGVCFAGVGCGKKSPPSDSYPVPPIKLPTGILVLILALGLLFVLAAFKYWRSRRSKKSIKAQLEAFRDSIVGIRAAECSCIPKILKPVMDLERASGESMTVASVEMVRWMWQETPQCMDQHNVTDIHGDPNDCWILYDNQSSKDLEEAYQNRKSKVSPLPGYTVDITKMEQTKIATGFKRKVQRIVEDVTATVDEGDSQKIDLSDVEIGDDLPDDLEGEPRMVLVDGDVIQISQQRKDGWAFGTKLYHADEAVARHLVRVALHGIEDDDANVFPDTGWFQLDKTRVPTADDLVTLQRNMGDTGSLDPPSHWSPVVDPSVVQQHELGLGDPERSAVENAFLSTLRPPQFHQSVKVIKVERIQNLSMWQSYVVKRQTICYRETGHNQSGDNDDLQQRAMERFERKWLFHGSNREVMDKILQQGFNRSFCGKNATAYGKGVYFARDASYSAHSMYAIPDHKGNQYMMACRVVVGEYCRGKMDALTPDVRDPKTQTLYDSTVGTASCPMANPSIYVTYHDAQAYPEYLITFRSA